MKRKYSTMIMSLALAASMAAAPVTAMAADYTSNDLNKVQSEIAAANEKKASASRTVEKLKNAVSLKNDIAAKKTAYAAAQAAAKKAQADYDAVNASVSKDLTAAQAAANAAQKDYDNAKAKFDEGVYGFYESEGESGANAIQILNEATDKAYTKKGDPDDATSLDNVKASFQWMKECNSLRESNGLSPLRVNSSMMAYAQSDANYSDSAMAHARQFNIGENLAWYYADPFDAWYTEEKQNYESHNGKETGHYLNIINKGYTLTGFAICSRGNNPYGGNTHDQVFSWSDSDDETIDDYEAKFDAYYASVDPSAKKAALDAANKKVSDLKAKTDAASKALSDAKSAEASAKTAYESADKAYKAIRTELNLKGEPESALAEAETKEANAEKAVSILADYESDAQKALSGVKMYRLYNPNSGEHFYTQSNGERKHLVSIGWRYEGIGWTAPKTSNTPVYRLYNKNAGDHHYTTKLSERRHLLNIGWKDEGIAWYSDDAKGLPLYRQYNKNAKAGSHNYTTSKVENDHLVKAGWKAEGIGWYGINTEAKSVPDVSSLLK